MNGYNEIFLYSTLIIKTEYDHGVEEIFHQNYAIISKMKQI